MNSHTPPPRGLGWLAGSVGRVLVLGLATVALLLSLFVGYRYTQLTDCLQRQAVANSTYLQRLAGPTDVQRAAERVLLEPGGDPAAERRAVLDARAVVDRVRRDNPPPSPTACT